jgi:DNA-binding IclR family transcriptional regulator
LPNAHPHYYDGRYTSHRYTVDRGSAFAAPSTQGEEHVVGVEHDPAVLVLTSLAEGPKHGYAITRDIADTVAVTLGPGTLYGVLSRLEDEGLIEPLPAEGRRRPYQLTPAGVTALANQADRMRQVATLGLRRLGLTTGAAS